MVQTTKAQLLSLVRRIPLGRVASFEAIADELKIPAALVLTMLTQMGEDDRELVPWHRVVAKGGAIGRGPHRDQQFARLVREGVLVSPAGIVQDLPRHMISSFDEASLTATASPDVPKPGNRSRGMKQRP
jgi:methylated-DNA-protein-cysteine methyltransferase-like protein